MPRSIPFAPALPDLPTLLPLARQLVRDIDGLGAQLPPHTVDAVHRLLRDATTYYSNLIEGHDTHPVFLDAARQGAISRAPALRNGQIEALAHAETHAEYETLLAKDERLNVAATAVIVGVHRSFYSRLPIEMRTVRDVASTRSVIVEPGVLRDYDVHVGAHVAPPYHLIASALQAFGTTYDPAVLIGEPDAGAVIPEDTRTAALVAVAAAHHRLLWIHPFGDGNGRVARLVTDLMLARLGLGARGLWSMSRGLARAGHLYKERLANADQGPWNATDGRGPLSERFLREFCAFFLETAADQVSYMRRVLAPDELRARARDYARRRAQREIPAPDAADDITRSTRRVGRPALAFRAEAARVLEHLLTIGPLPRGEVARVASMSERSARRMASDLVKEGFAVSATPRGDLLPRIPAHAAPYLLPELFPVAPRVAG
ncbi:MAG: Fic family protein [Gemmatimonadota bacterium]|nr:Fic family protein [Gemmatimonadota bacterium]